MKKLLSILSAVMLVSSASLPVVGCSIGSRVDESIDPVLEQQNFNMLLDKRPGEKLFNSIPDKKDFYFSNGFDGDNKYISDRSNGIEGSFGSSKWSFIDMLNTKLDLGLKRNASAVEVTDDLKNKIVTQGDAEEYGINWDVTNIEKLGELEVSKVEGSYQEGGDKPADTESEKSIEAFNNIVKIGDADWNKQLDFFKSPEFIDRTYTKKTTIKLDKKEFTFTQIIMIQNTGVFYNHNSKPAPGESWIEKEVATIDDIYNRITGLSNGKDLPGFSRDEFKNLIFSKMNIFTAEKQDYSVAVSLDCNNLRNQLENAVNNAESIASEYINNNNKKIFANYFSDVIKNRTKQSTNGNHSNKVEFDDPAPSSNSISIKGEGNNQTSIDFGNPTEGLELPRIGMTLKPIQDSTDKTKTIYRLNDEFFNNIISYINLQIPNTWSAKVDPKQLDISVTKKNPDSLTPNVFEEGDIIVITNNPDYSGNSKLTISGSSSLTKYDDNNMLKENSSIINKNLIYVKSGTLLNNDWLYKTLNVRSVDDLKTKASNYWIESLDKKGNVSPSQIETGVVGDIRSKTVDPSNLKNLLNNMAELINKTVFKSSLNKDGLLITNTKAYLTDADYSNPINLNFDVNGTLDK